MAIYMNNNFKETAQIAVSFIIIIVKIITIFLLSLLPHFLLNNSLMITFLIY